MNLIDSREDYVIPPSIMNSLGDTIFIMFGALIIGVILAIGCMVWYTNANHHNTIRHNKIKISEPEWCDDGYCIVDVRDG